MESEDFENAEDVVCPFCSTPLEVIESCPHYLGGGDRGNDDDFNDVLCGVASVLSSLIEELDESEYERLIAIAPDDLAKLFELAQNEGKYYWMDLEGVIVTSFESSVTCMASDNEDCFHKNRESFIKKTVREAERGIEWLMEHRGQ